MDVTANLYSQLTKPLATYNSSVNDTMTAVATAIRGLALVILTIFVLIELGNIRKQIENEGGGMTAEVYASLILKYIFAFILVQFSSELVDAILWGFTKVTELIHAHVTVGYKLAEIPKATHHMNFLEKGVYLMMTTLSQIISWFAAWVGQILVFMRSVQMYIYKALAPIMVVFFMNDEMRSTTIGYLKQFAGIALQGSLIILILAIFPVFIQSDLLFSLDSSGMSGFFQDLGVVIAVVGKDLVLVFLLFGSQNLAKRMMGAA